MNRIATACAIAVALALTACAGAPSSPACVPSSECRCGDPEVDVLGCCAACQLLQSTDACPNHLCVCCARRK